MKKHLFNTINWNLVRTERFDGTWINTVTSIPVLVRWKFRFREGQLRWQLFNLCPQFPLGGGLPKRGKAQAFHIFSSAFCCWVWDPLFSREAGAPFSPQTLIMSQRLYPRCHVTENTGGPLFLALACGLGVSYQESKQDGLGAFFYHQPLHRDLLKRGIPQKEANHCLCRPSRAVTQRFSHFPLRRILWSKDNLSLLRRNGRDWVQHKGAPKCSKSCGENN